MNFIEELKWRGMIHDVMPGTEEQLNKEMTVAYTGFDPTATSMHIGNLSSIMLLKFFQLSGHKPIIVIGGGTGMIGDPSGKSSERNLLDEETLRHNQECIKKQFMKLLDFGNIPNAAEMINNYDWLNKLNLIGFLRDIGKHITINYMLAKDSVKKRLETGISYTEFAYQMLQGYDYLHLYETKNCKLQMGGSDQWGNIVTGTELIRRKVNGDAYALTSPLITKSDGGKFGKTEEGNIWLDAKLTSPYKFYQFWLNVSDEDAAKFIKIFTLHSKEEIENIEAEHLKAPHLRLLQKTLAKDVTIMVHSENDYSSAVEASEILFGKGTTESLKKLDEKTLLSVFEGVPQCNISKDKLPAGVNIVDFLTELTNIFPSKSEARRTLKENGVMINKEKATETQIINNDLLLNGKYILVQKGKKNYFLVKAE
ncbi:MAG: tyrosine--tRNA ligase [Bacteroidales bacterium]|nr:tyrosine--tRNA ligase [Bacteroidales bacterium]